MELWQTIGGYAGRVWRWARRHKLFTLTFSGALALPMLLSPAHPIAVYGYLLARYVPLIQPARGCANEAELASFLIAPEQVRAYRSDILADLLDVRSGKLFVIVQCPKGTLQQAPIRTWNSFLPATLPARLSKKLDLKELPFMSDAVSLWLEGKTIVAAGHYHPYGGPPSGGDAWAQRFSPWPEVVVANGIAPVVYIDGAMIPYGSDVSVSKDLFRSLRTLMSSLFLVSDFPSPIPTEPSPALVSFLAYLRDYCQTDLQSVETVAASIGDLQLEFAEQCAPVFDLGLDPLVYTDNIDKRNMLQCMLNVQLWVCSVRDHEAIRRKFNLPPPSRARRDAFLKAMERHGQRG